MWLQYYNDYMLCTLLNELLQEEIVDVVARGKVDVGLVVGAAISAVFSVIEKY